MLESQMANKRKVTRDRELLTFIGQPAHNVNTHYRMRKQKLQP